MTSTASSRSSKARMLATAMEWLSARALDRRSAPPQSPMPYAYQEIGQNQRTPSAMDADTARQAP